MKLSSHKTLHISLKLVKIRLKVVHKHKMPIHFDQFTGKLINRTISLTNICFVFFLFHFIDRFAKIWGLHVKRNILDWWNAAKKRAHLQ